MNVDTDTLRKIREHRVNSDPLVPHPRKSAWLESTPGNIHEFIIEARANRIDDLPTDQPVQKATWPEATVFCFTRSMDAAIDQREHLGAYQYCFDNMAQDHIGESFEALTGGSIDIVTTDRHRDLAETFREYIAAAQHEAFLVEEYDNLPFDVNGVPKAFWRADLQNKVNNDKDDTDGQDNSQIELTDF